MVSLLRTALRAALGQPPRLVCPSRIWNKGVTELNRRTSGTRESGAFLLGTMRGRVRRIQEFLFYDEC